MYTTIKLTEGRYTSLQPCKVLMEILCLPRRRVYLSNLQKILANSKDTCRIYGLLMQCNICGEFLLCKVYFHIPQKRLALHVLLTPSWFCIHLRVSSQRFIQLYLDQQSISAKACSNIPANGQNQVGMAPLSPNAIRRHPVHGSVTPNTP